MVIAVAGTATAVLNVATAWKTSDQKDKTQAAVLKSSREVNQTLEALDDSVVTLAPGMYQELVTRVVPAREEQP